nr:hypothetical protein [uncultured Cohaesibacter sp.]
MKHTDKFPLDDMQRTKIRVLKQLLTQNPDLVEQYEQAKKTVRVFRRPAFYEMSTRCNLRCEGCYFFDREQQNPHDEEQDLSVWDAFFAAEAERGVSMGYFVGAEPSLEQERLKVAARYIRYGNVGTNGSVFISREIPFKIGIALWGSDDAMDRRMRGASVFRKALKNYAEDPRAIFLYTVNAWNFDQCETAVQLCQDAGVPITFNLFSPTKSLLHKLGEAAPNDNEFFRVSRPEKNPCIEDEHLKPIRDTLARLIDAYPETVVYSHAYNKWSTSPGPLYSIDERTGIAEDCHSRIRDPMNYYTSTLESVDVKCCTHEIDCRHCRMYSAGWSSKFEPSLKDLQSRNSFCDWMEMIGVLSDIFVY